jgi:hypothetical protein
LLKQIAAWALAFPRASVGRRREARIAMMAMTTMSSMSVNAADLSRPDFMRAVVDGKPWMW